MAYCTGCGALFGDEDTGRHMCAPGSVASPIIGPMCTRCGRAVDETEAHVCDPVDVPAPGEEVKR